MGGGFILYSGITPPSTPPRSPRPESSERTRLVPPVNLNNQAIDAPKHLQADVWCAADRICSNWGNASSLKAELVLNPDILIPLLNHAKLYWHDWLAKHPEETSASERIENAFINNINLSKEESDWVRKTIGDYKNLLNMTISKGNSNPIPPIWMVHKEPVSKKYSYYTL